MVQFKILYMLLIMYRAENGQHLRPKPRQRVCSMCRTSCVLGWQKSLAAVLQE